MIHETVITLLPFLDKLAGGDAAGLVLWQCHREAENTCSLWYTVALFPQKTRAMVNYLQGGMKVSGY